MLILFNPLVKVILKIEYACETQNDMKYED